MESSDAAAAKPGMTLEPRSYVKETSKKGKKSLYSKEVSSHTSHPVVANFPSEKTTIGGGVAIFHLASQRVVLCYHTAHKYWFLPKGRKDANEDSGSGAEREGFEESGYRNRRLPIPMRHRQPHPYHSDDVRFTEYHTEAVWTQLAPVGSGSQYILFWYIAETLPPDEEALLNEKDVNARAAGMAVPYYYPSRYPQGLKIKDRIAMEPEGYEPVRHENTGVNEDEMLYTSHLLPIQEAMTKVQGTVMEDVIKRGWDAILIRMAMEN